MYIHSCISAIFCLPKRDQTMYVVLKNDTHSADRRARNIFQLHKERKERKQICDILLKAKTKEIEKTVFLQIS